MGLRTTGSHWHTKKYMRCDLIDPEMLYMYISGFIFYFSRLVNWPFFPTVQENALSKWNLCLCVKNHVPQTRSHDFWCLCVCMYVQKNSPEKDQRAL